MKTLIKMYGGFLPILYNGPDTDKGGFSMHWILLVVAGLFETAWAVGLKYTEGFTRLYPTIFTLIAMALSVWLLSLALKVLPVGTGYAVWTGIGAVGAVLVGMFFLGEPKDFARVLSIALILAGIVGLKLTSPH